MNLFFSIVSRNAVDGTGLGHHGNIGDLRQHLTTDGLTSIHLFNQMPTVNCCLDYKCSSSCCSCDCDAIRERLRLGGPAASIQYASTITASNYRESATNNRTSRTSETSVGRGNSIGGACAFCRECCNSYLCMDGSSCRLPGRCYSATVLISRAYLEDSISIECWRSSRCKRAREHEPRRTFWPGSANVPDTT